MASAMYLPPDPALPATVPSPSAVTTFAHLSVPVILAMAAGIVLVSVASTLVTLALIRRWERQRRAANETPACGLHPDSAPEPQSSQADILVSHPGHHQAFRE
jgi:hypothetical protein